MCLAVCVHIICCRVFPVCVSGLPFGAVALAGVVWCVPVLFGLCLCASVMSGCVFDGTLPIWRAFDCDHCVRARWHLTLGCRVVLAFGVELRVVIVVCWTGGAWVLECVGRGLCCVGCRCCLNCMCVPGIRIVLFVMIVPRCVAGCLFSC